MAIPGYVPKKYDYWIRSASTGTGLPEPVVAAQIDDESGFQEDVTSSAGAEGFAQFLPSTYAAEGGVGTEYKARNELKPYIRLTNENLKWAGGDVAKALAAYNAGQGDWQAGEGYASTILSNANDMGLTVKPKSGASASTTSIISGAQSFGSLIGDVTSADFWERAALIIFGAVLIVVGIVILALPAAKTTVSEIGSTSRALNAATSAFGSSGNSGGPTEEEKADRDRRLSLAERNASVGETKAQTQLLRERRLSANPPRRRQHKSGIEPNPNPTHS